MKWYKIVGNILDVVARIVIGVLILLAWLDDDYEKALFMVALLIVFQLHDIWRELK